MATGTAQDMTRKSRQRRLNGQSGFSLLELVIALTILAVGTLALASTTIYAVRSVTLADLATERTAARQSAMENLRALPFDSIATGTDSRGIFSMNWGVTDYGEWKSISLITAGPGRMVQTDSVQGGMIGDVADTLTFTVLRP